MDLTCALPVAPPQEATSEFSSADRRTLGALLGFLAGLAALGPIAALGGALAGHVAARMTEAR